MRLLATLAIAVLLAVFLRAGEGDKAEVDQGRNEAAAIAACKTYAEAQDIYRRTDWDSDGILEYAQSIRGGNYKFKAVEPKDIPAPSAEDEAAFKKLTPGLASEDFSAREAANTAIEKIGPKAITLLEKAAKELEDVEARARCERLALKLKDEILKKQGKANSEAQRWGLYSTAKGDGDLTLVDKAMAEAEGSPSEKPTPKAGYCFKLLTGQGPGAVGGRRTYIVRGENMTLGYAVVAYPSKYGETGKHTFIINNTGTVYQRDLGAETAKQIEEMTEYNPERGSWVVSE